VGIIESHLAQHTRALMGHRYFRLCQGGLLDRTRLLNIIKQLYCFSVFFERLLTLRMGRYSSSTDERVLRSARQHLREEIGHAELFRHCLASNGVPPSEIAHLAPKTFTKALFGYLLATVLYENEYVTNVAMMQVMETIGLHFFKATLPEMKRHRMVDAAFRQHTLDDEQHSKIGLDLAAEFDPRTMNDCLRVIRDLYGLMEHVLEEWLEPAETPSPRVASSRPAALHLRSTRDQAGSAPPGVTGK
jgi:hypothetical protein